MEKGDVPKAHLLFLNKSTKTLCRLSIKLSVKLLTKTIAWRMIATDERKGGF